MKLVIFDEISSFQSSWMPAILQKLKMVEQWHQFYCGFVMAAIKYGQQHVEIEELTKCRWFLLQVSTLNGRVMAAISVIFGNGCHQRWLTNYSS